MAYARLFVSRPRQRGAQEHVYPDAGEPPPPYTTDPAVKRLRYRASSPTATAATMAPFSATPRTYLFAAATATAATSLLTETVALP